MLADLRPIVGDEHAREGGPADATGGAEPAAVASPASAEETSAVLRLAHRSGWKVAVVGGSTRAHWGNPPRHLDLVVSTRRLDALIEHGAGDLVVSAQAGMRLDELQRAVAGAGQMLALDPPGATSTLGGVIAANASGPRRLRYGTVRDLLIGINVVLADGTIAKAGGKVVKNVAGYDLAKLFTGSFGTLGAIASATFRLHPVPAATRLLVLAAGAPDGAGTAVQRLLASTLVPSAIELSEDAGRRLEVVVLFEGIEAGVEEQSRQAAQLLGDLGAVETFAAEEAGRRWADLQAPPSGTTAVLKVAHLPSALAGVLDLVRETAARHGLEAGIRGHAGTGILHVSLSGEADALQPLVGDLRAALRPGSVTMLQAPLEVRRRVDAWGPVGDSLPLMRRVKEQFDPAGMLNPGRFVGGI
jgi:glycolate oxidase FAD binding subunit